MFSQPCIARQTNYCPMARSHRRNHPTEHSSEADLWKPRTFVIMMITKVLGFHKSASCDIMITCSLEKARRKNKTSLLDRVLGSKGSKVMKVLRTSSSFPTINSLNLLLMQGVRDGTRRVCKCHFWAFSCHFLQRALSILPVNLPFLKQKDLVLI